MTTTAALTARPYRPRRVVAGVVLATNTVDVLDATIANVAAPSVHSELGDGAASAGFTVFSAACALAPNVGTLIAFRALQGAFGALMILAGALMNADLWPRVPDQRADRRAGADRDYLGSRARSADRRGGCRSLCRPAVPVHPVQREHGRGRVGVLVFRLPMQPRAGSAE